MDFFKHLEGLFTSQIGIAKGLWALFKFEAKLAELTIYPLIISIVMLFVFSLTTWLLLMMFIGYACMLAAGGSVVWGMGGVLIINLLVILYLLKRISTGLKYLSFKKTRACIKHYPLRERDESAEETISLNSDSRKTCEPRAT